MSDRSREYGACESLNDREVNAPINKLDKAVSLTVLAYGEESSGSVGTDGVKQSSMTQEVSSGFKRWEYVKLAEVSSSQTAQIA